MSGSSYQTTISLASASTGTLNGCFKLKAPAKAGISLTKTTEDGQNLSGWQFGIYADAGCTSLVSGPHTTDASGAISVTGLTPGTVYVKEIGHTDSAINAQYTCTSANPQKVTLAAGQTASVSFHNALAMGRIEFRKTTNTGNHLGGWAFRVTDSSHQLVGEYTTDENGYAITEPLPLGRYHVQELPVQDDYWQIELTGHDVVVEAGKTTVDSWHNIEQGLGWFYKKTNTGENLAGWEITIYRDEACTDVAAVTTTNEEGKTGYYLDPGVYYAKETGDTLGRFEDANWKIDESVQKFEIKPHEETAVEFTNLHCGSLKIIKTVTDGTSPEGWTFKVTDSEGTEIPGSPFVSGPDGTIFVGGLLPGEYTVEEILPEDSWYVCQGENPQTVTVAQGQTAEVSFVNELLPGRITVHKADIHNDPLAGAAFLLEWSEGGTSWQPVFYSETTFPTKGGCSNPDVVDGCLTSGEDGLLEWANLHPGLQYRLTEVEAPEGFRLLSDTAFEGTLPEDDLILEIRVINARIFTMPDTGSNSLTLLPLMGYLIMASILLFLGSVKRKEVC